VDLFTIISDSTILSNIRRTNYHHEPAPLGGADDCFKTSCTPIACKEYITQRSSSTRTCWWFPAYV